MRPRNLSKSERIDVRASMLIKQMLHEIARVAAMLATGVLLPATAFAASDCALAPGRPGVVVAYSGECRDGRIHGVADVMIELPPSAAGRKRQARQFGWFQRGIPQGVHVAVFNDPDGRRPGFPMLFHFDAAGQTSWSFGQPSAYWPQQGTLLASGPWEDVDGKARQAGIDYTVAKRADGTSYGEGMAMIADILNQAVEFSLAADVQSVNPATVRQFLASVSITQPLASVGVRFPVAAIFPDSNEEAPGVHAVPVERGTDATLQAGEILVKTREGCGLITALGDEKYRQVVIDSSLRKSWLGECVDGMVLGPGTMLVRTNDDRISLIQQLWYFNGRPIGESTTTSFSFGGYTGGTTEGFSWNDTGFSYSRSALGKPVAQSAVSSPPMVMESSPQRKVIYTLLRSEGGWSKECGPEGSVCLQERILGSIPSTVNHLPCRKNDCTVLWAEKVVPILTALEAFKARHAADIAAKRQSVDSILVPLLTAQKLASREAQVASIIRDAQGAHASERAKAAAAAEQARIAAARAKEAEATAKAESRSKFWGNLVSGATALVGAAAAYTDAMSGTSTDDARTASLGQGDSGGESASGIDEAIRKSALSAKPCLREVDLMKKSAVNPAAVSEYPAQMSPHLDYLRRELRTFDTNTMRYVKTANGAANVRKAFFEYSGKTMMQRRIDEHWFDDIAINTCLRKNRGISLQQCQYNAYSNQVLQCQDYFKHFFITGKIEKLPRGLWSEAIYSEMDLKNAEALRDEVLGRN